MNEEDYMKWIDYPPGVYSPRDIWGREHPSNTCSYKVGDNPVLICINYSTDIPKGTAWEDRKVIHTGWYITVWRPEPGAIISTSRVVRSLGEIDKAVEELIVEVMAMCQHKNSESLPARWMHEHRFKCLDCGETWGYDSSG